VSDTNDSNQQSSDVGADFVQRFRKRPVEIEAVKITDDLSIAAIFGWMSAHGVMPTVRGDARPFGLVIPTLEGDLLASSGDYVIRGVEGEFYPCKPTIFEATYEAASS
jgi:hypothetical protein